MGAGGAPGGPIRRLAAQALRQLGEAYGTHDDRVYDAAEVALTVVGRLRRPGSQALWDAAQSEAGDDPLGPRLELAIATRLGPRLGRTGFIQIAGADR